MFDLDFELFILPKLQNVIEKHKDNKGFQEIIENLKEMESDVKEYITQKQGMSKLYLMSSTRYVDAFENFHLGKK